MSILGNLETKSTGQRLPLRSCVTAVVDAEQTGKSQSMGFGTNDEYEMSLRVSCTFWSGSLDSQKREAFAAARQNIASHLYADILSKLSDARSAAIGSDFEATMTALSDIRKTILDEL